MTHSKPFLRQTAMTAMIAAREYFRPLLMAIRLLKSCITSTEKARSSQKGGTPDPIVKL
jgi:hypothetical protein